jgi:hypothetical protein
VAPRLLIRDGIANWWLSPDIWVVPGSDPNGTPRPPIAGDVAYLWAHVANTGDVEADNARLDFYWSNPALGVLRSKSTHIGFAFANIPAGGGIDVLCLTPWPVAFVNGGHECLVVVASHPADPLPNPLNDDFDPRSYRQVAQLNLNVLAGGPRVVPLPPLTISAPRRLDRNVVVSAVTGGPLDPELLAHLQIERLEPADKEFPEVGLSHNPTCVPDDERLGPKQLRLHLLSGASAAVYVSLRARRLAKGRYHVVNIIEQSGDEVLGGYSYIVIPADEGRAL